MKKRLLSMLMAVLMIASLVPATALAAPVDHTGHDVATISIKKDAAAKQPGIEVKVCNKDGDLISSSISAFAEPKDICLRHTYKTVELQAATCSQVGVKATYCSVCGTAAAEKAVVVADKEKPSYTKFVVEQKPTCLEDGWGYVACDKCGEAVFVANAADALAKLKMNEKHTYAQEQAVLAQFSATNNDGQGNHKDTDKFVAVAKDVYKDFDVVWDNSAIGKVVKNVLVMKAEVKPTHSLTVNGSVVDGKVVADNNVSVYKWVKLNAGTGADPYSEGKWVDYGGVLVQDQTTNHGLGYTGDSYCPDCKAVVRGENALGLNTKHAGAMELKAAGYYPYVDKDGVKHDGVSDVWYCKTCGVEVGGKTLAYDTYANKAANMVIGDTWVEDAKPATCFEVGSTGTTYRWSKLANGTVAAQVIAEAKEIPMLKHTLVKVDSKVGKCGEFGWTCNNYYFCSNEVKMPDGTTWQCPYTQGTVIANKLPGEHNWQSKELVPATCQKTGLAVVSCSVCGELAAKTVDSQGDVWYKEAKADRSDVFVDVIKTAPHTAGDPVNAKEATCTEVGYTGDKVCKWCGIMLEKGKEIPMKEHTVVDVAAVEATCTTDGMTAGTKCSVCGTVLSGCEVVKALGHDYKDGKCTRCGEKDPNYVAPEFKDAASIRDYAKDAVAWAAKEGIVKGDDNGNFLPTADITRQDFVTMLWRLKGSVASEKALTFGDKADIKDYAQTAVAWAVENGYINGRDNGNFDPAAKITRAEIVAILNRIAENAKAEKAADFTDIATHWAKDAIAWAAEAGIVNGVGNNMFAPNDNASRQDTVVMLYKFVNLK